MKSASTKVKALREMMMEFKELHHLLVLIPAVHLE
jgi:hypothetical protein